MAFDFPSSPTVGQQYTPIAGTTYVWNGYAWAAALPSPTTTPRLDVISQLTISAPVSSAIIVLPAGYSSFDLKIVGLVLSASNPVYMQFSNDGGATYLTTGYYMNTVYSYASTVTSVPYANQAQGYIVSSSLANQALIAEFTIRPGPSTTPADIGWIGRVGSHHPDGTMMNYLWYGRQLSSGNRLTHVRFYSDGGINLTAGKITLLGLT